MKMKNLCDVLFVFKYLGEKFLARSIYTRKEEELQMMTTLPQGTKEKEQIKPN